MSSSLLITSDLLYLRSWWYDKHITPKFEDLWAHGAIASPFVNRGRHTFGDLGWVQGTMMIVEALTCWVAVVAPQVSEFA